MEPGNDGGDGGNNIRLRCIPIVIIYAVCVAVFLIGLIIYLFAPQFGSRERVLARVGEALIIASSALLMILLFLIGVSMVTKGRVAPWMLHPVPHQHSPDAPSGGVSSANATEGSGGHVDFGDGNFDHFHLSSDESDHPPNWPSPQRDDNGDLWGGRVGPPTELAEPTTRRQRLSHNATTTAPPGMRRSLSMNDLHLAAADMDSVRFAGNLVGIAGTVGFRGDSSSALRN